MLLTQRAALTDLQAYLGLSLTELPNAEATTLINKAYYELYSLFDAGDLYFDDTNTKKQSIQKNAEVHLAAYYYFTEYGVKHLLMDFETYEMPLNPSLNIGGVKISEKGNSKQELRQYYKEKAEQNYKLCQNELAILLKGESDPESTSSFL